MFWLLALMLLGMLTSCNTALKRENERLREELARQQQYIPLNRDTVRDTVEIVSQKIVEVEKVKEVLTSDDRALLEELKIKLKEVESFQKLSTVTQGEVTLNAAGKDSSNKKNDSLYYHDMWADFEYKNRKLRYSVRDSLAIAVRREYKHRLLWFRWGLKGFEVKVANFNPHSTIKYNTFVKRKE